MDVQSLVGEPMLTVWSLLGALLGTLLITAVTLWAGAQVTRQARGLWAALRGHRAEIVAAVDEPADPVNARLEQITTIPAGVWAALLPAFFNALAAALDQTLGAQRPD
jgi:hypothetical protein